MGAFSEDKSKFKNRILVTALLSVVALASGIVLSSMFVTKTAENNALKSEYAAQNAWLQKFDYKDATNLYKLILKPCKEAELDKVSGEQLDILKNHKLSVVSIKNDVAADGSKSALKARKTSVDVVGDWPNIMAALNEFEKKHFVVITNADFTTEKTMVKAKLDYNIYYN